MRLLVEMSAEHPTLPLAELSVTVRLAGGEVMETDGAVALVEAPPEAPAFLARRLALSHSISEWWWSGEAIPETIVAALSSRDLGGATFAVRPRSLEGAHAGVSLTGLAREAGAVLARTGKVDLRAPQVDVRIMLAGRAHAGRLLAEVDRGAFEARHPKHRAHFAPVSIHPRFARALVNMAGVREGDLVADPFVGTGGLMLEAASVGARVLASDLDPRMVAGTRATMEQMGLAEGARFETRDVGELPEFAGEGVDVVLSDPPYGRSSTTNFEAMETLYERFFAAAHDALRPGGRLAMISPSESLRGLAERRFRLVESHDQRVHRSMTRHWGVFARE